MLAIVSAIFIAALSGCNQKQDYVGFVFGTNLSIHLNEKQTSKTIRQINGALADLEKLTSTALVGSDIAKINKSAANTPITVAKATFYLLKWSKELYLATDSAFNPAIFPLVKLWNFDPEGYIGAAETIPSAEQISSTLAYCNFDYFLLDEKELTVSKTHPQAMLDLGAIAKGYGLDMAVDIIKSNGFLSIGGSIGVKGDSKNIGIHDPRGGKTFGVFALGNNEKVSTSGDYHRFYFASGIRYHHIIDPTGYPAGLGQENPAICVSVIAKSGLITDALSTAFMILPFEKIEQLAKKYDCKGVIIYADKSYATFGGYEFELINNEYSKAI